SPNRGCWFSRPATQDIGVTGGWFPEGRNPLRLDSPCYLFAKHGLLGACVAPHRYLSGPALSPPGGIPGSYGPTACRPPVRPAGLRAPSPFAHSILAPRGALKSPPPGAQRGEAGTATGGNAAGLGAPSGGCNARLREASNRPRTIGIS